MRMARAKRRLKPNGAVGMMNRRRSGERRTASPVGSIRQVILSLAFLFLATLSFAGTASADPVLTITPAEVALTPGVPEKIVVILAGTPDELHEAHLEIFPPTGLRTNASKPAPISKGTKGWIVTLQADASLITSSAALLVRTPPRLLTGSFKVSPAASPAATAEFTAELIYDGESLFDRAEGQAHLRLINLGESTLALNPTLMLPAFLKRLCQDGKPCSTSETVTLKPRAGAVIDYRIAVAATDEHPLTSGKYQISARVEATRVNAARPWQGSQIVTREVTVGIPGLGDIQTIIQVPSFLLLPGFLICVVAMMTWRLWHPPAPEAGKPVAWLSVAMSPALWVLAISLSMGVVWAYPTVSDWFGHGRRNLLQGFDLSDVLNVWVSSILIGFVAGNAGVGLVALRRWWDARSIFSSRDTPDQALRKMKRLNLSPTRLMVDTPVAGRLFQVADAAEAGKAWAISSIRYEPLPGFDAEAFVAALAADDIDRIVAMVDQGMDRKTLKLNWAATGGAKGPRIVDGTIFDKPDQKELVLDPV